MNINRKLQTGRYIKCESENSRGPEHLEAKCHFRRPSLRPMANETLFFPTEVRISLILSPWYRVSIKKPRLTSQDVSLVHELGSEKDRVVGFPLLQEVPHEVPWERVQSSSWLIQEQNLQWRARESTFRLERGSSENNTEPSATSALRVLHQVPNRLAWPFIINFPSLLAAEMQSGL